MVCLLPGGVDKMTYGGVPLSPLIFMDDVLHGAKGIKEARIANLKMDRVAKRLNLRYNEDDNFLPCNGLQKTVK